ncbi:MAG TPA: Na-translocating system protein MpsC family protein [Solirubrobacteraceae bacterium]|nr:Na-translocating system protein MpsC family protein [Solirubrobacteraceae bacterium]
MADSHAHESTSPLAAISNALVALHKEQFGRGPTRARTEYAGPDALVCIMEDALLPAEKAMVEMGAAHRVQESRLFFQSATAQHFVAAVERTVGRKVRSFSSSLDPHEGVVAEIYVLFPRDGG